MGRNRNTIHHQMKIFGHQHHSIQYKLVISYSHIFEKVKYGYNVCHLAAHTLDHSSFLPYCERVKTLVTNSFLRPLIFFLNRNMNKWLYVPLSIVRAGQDVLENTGVLELHKNDEDGRFNIPDTSNLK